MKATFCDIYGNICFEKSMDNVTIDEDCGCPHECNSMSYTFGTVSAPFDPLKICPNNIRSKEFLMKEFYNTEVHRKFPPKFIRRIHEFRYNITSEDGVICKKNINYRAEIIFRLATKSLSVNVMSRRLSFFDQLSAFGKNSKN